MGAKAQMGWAEELPKPAEAASVLRIIQGHQGLRQILQEPAFLLDPRRRPLRAGRPALHGTEHDRWHNPVSSQLGEEDPEQILSAG